MIAACTSTSVRDNVVRIFAFSFGISYVSIGATFAVLGHRFYTKFKIVCPELAVKIKTRLQFNIGIVFVLFQLRGWFVIARGIHDFIPKFKKESLQTGNAGFIIFNFLYYTTVSLIPTIMQIIMLRYLIFDRRTQVVPENESRTVSAFWDYVEDTNATLQNQKEESFISDSDLYATTNTKTTTD